MAMTKPATDLAYLLSTNIDTNLRRAIEHDVIDNYLDRLRSFGINGYDKSTFENEFRLALLCISGIPVIATASVDANNARSVRLGTTISQRMFQTIEDWDAMFALN